AISGFGADRTASIADIAVIYEGRPIEQLVESEAYVKTASATAEMYEAINPLDYSTNPSAPLIAQVSADSESATDPAVSAFDGKPNTFWHTQWRDKVPVVPHELTIELKKSRNIRGLRYLPRQDRDNGRIEDYEIQLSSDGKTYRTVKSGKFANNSNRQEAMFAAPVSAMYVRLKALSEVNGQNYISVAEIELVEE
ncbi:MAG: discoidin domain-containing protein, partial [Phycisphaerae bacterium]